MMPEYAPIGVSLAGGEEVAILPFFSGGVIVVYGVVRAYLIAAGAEGAVIAPAGLAVGDGDIGGGAAVGT